jgi:hypothetical protein
MQVKKILAGLLACSVIAGAVGIAPTSALKGAFEVTATYAAEVDEWGSIAELPFAEQIEKSEALYTEVTTEIEGFPSGDAEALAEAIEAAAEGDEDSIAALVSAYDATVAAYETVKASAAELEKAAGLLDDLTAAVDALDSEEDAEEVQALNALYTAIEEAVGALSDDLSDEALKNALVAANNAAEDKLDPDGPDDPDEPGTPAEEAKKAIDKTESAIQFRIDKNGAAQDALEALVAAYEGGASDAELIELTEAALEAIPFAPYDVDGSDEGKDGSGAPVTLFDLIAILDGVIGAPTPAGISWDVIESAYMHPVTGAPAISAVVEAAKRISRFEAVKKYQNEAFLPSLIEVLDEQIQAVVDDVAAIADGIDEILAPDPMSDADKDLARAEREKAIADVSKIENLLNKTNPEPSPEQKETLEQALEDAKEVIDKVNKKLGETPPPPPPPEVDLSDYDTIINDIKLAQARLGFDGTSDYELIDDAEIALSAYKTATGKTEKIAKLFEFEKQLKVLNDIKADIEKSVLSANELSKKLRAAGGEDVYADELYDAFSDLTDDANDTVDAIRVIQVQYDVLAIVKRYTAATMWLGTTSILKGNDNNAYQNLLAAEKTLMDEDSNKADLLKVDLDSLKSTYWAAFDATKTDTFLNNLNKFETALAAAEAYISGTNASADVRAYNNLASVFAKISKLDEDGVITKAGTIVAAKTETNYQVANTQAAKDGLAVLAAVFTKGLPTSIVSGDTPRITGITVAEVLDDANLTAANVQSYLNDAQGYIDLADAELEADAMLAITDDILEDLKTNDDVAEQYMTETQITDLRKAAHKARSEANTIKQNVNRYDLKSGYTLYSGMTGAVTPAATTALVATMKASLSASALAPYNAIGFQVASDEAILVQLQDSLNKASVYLTDITLNAVSGNLEFAASGDAVSEKIVDALNGVDFDVVSFDEFDNAVYYGPYGTVTDFDEAAGNIFSAIKVDNSDLYLSQAAVDEFQGEYVKGLKAFIKGAVAFGAADKHDYFDADAALKASEDLNKATAKIGQAKVSGVLQMLKNLKETDAVTALAPRYRSDFDLLINATEGLAAGASETPLALAWAGDFLDGQFEDLSLDLDDADKVAKAVRVLTEIKAIATATSAQKRFDLYADAISEELTTEMITSLVDYLPKLTGIKTTIQGLKNDLEDASAGMTAAYKEKAAADARPLITNLITQLNATGTTTAAYNSLLAAFRPAYALASKVTGTDHTVGDADRAGTLYSPAMFALNTTPWTGIANNPWTSTAAQVHGINKFFGTTTSDGSIMGYLTANGGKLDGIAAASALTKLTGSGTAYKAVTDAFNNLNNVTSTTAVSTIKTRIKALETALDNMEVFDARYVPDGTDYVEWIYDVNAKDYAKDFALSLSSLDSYLGNIANADDLLNDADKGRAKILAGQGSELTRLGVLPTGVSDIFDVDKGLTDLTTAVAAVTVAEDTVKALEDALAAVELVVKAGDPATNATEQTQKKQAYDYAVEDLNRYLANLRTVLADLQGMYND